VAQGIYHLNYNTDSEIGLMFAWGNSYDKSMRFRCAIGGYVFVCGNGIIAGDMSNYGRKHVGDAKDEVSDHIKEQIKGASKYYKQLVDDKNVMKTITLDTDQIASLMGRLFITDEIITSSQMILVKDQMKNPAHDYGTSENNLWTIYNHITYALKKSHPKTWMESQKDLHKLVKGMFFPAKPFVDPDQLDLAVEAQAEEVIQQASAAGITADQIANAEVEDLTEGPEIIPPLDQLEEVGLEPQAETEEPLGLSLEDHPSQEEEPQQEEEPELLTSNEEQEKEEEENALPCQCGRTSNPDGLCDGTHAIPEEPKTDETGLLLEDEPQVSVEEKVEEISQPGISAADVEMSVPEGKEFNTPYNLDELGGEQEAPATEEVAVQQESFLDETEPQPDPVAEIAEAPTASTLDGGAELQETEDTGLNTEVEAVEAQDSPEEPVVTGDTQEENSNSNESPFEF
jgi:CDGSH-type Zn-finger protein